MNESETRKRFVPDIDDCNARMRWFIRKFVARQKSEQEKFVARYGMEASDVSDELIIIAGNELQQIIIEGDRDIWDYAVMPHYKAMEAAVRIFNLRQFVESAKAEPERFIENHGVSPDEIDKSLIVAAARDLADGDFDAAIDAVIIQRKAAEKDEGGV